MCKGVKSHRHAILMLSFCLFQKDMNCKLVLLQIQNITKTCPCNIQRIFSEAKIKDFIGKKSDILIILLKTNIDCGVHVRTASPINPCFGSKIRKIGIPLQTPVSLYKSGVFKRGYTVISWTCFLDVMCVVSTVLRITFRWNPSLY